VDSDEAEKVIGATEILVKEMIRVNNIEADDVASVWITVTEDITSAFPAKALRRVEGWKYVPVMCAREIPVPGSLEKCIRVMFHVHTEQKQDEIQHVYLEKAEQLRPDLNLTVKKS
jgi:chorismate mutase